MPQDAGRHDVPQRVRGLQDVVDGAEQGGVRGRPIWASSARACTTVTFPQPSQAMCSRATAAISGDSSMPTTPPCQPQRRPTVVYTMLEIGSRKNPKFQDVKLQKVADVGGKSPRGDVLGDVQFHRTGRKFVVLSKRERYIAVTTVVAVGLLAVIYGLVSPLLDRKSELDEKVKDAKLQRNCADRLIDDSHRLGPMLASRLAGPVKKNASEAESQMLKSIGEWARNARMMARRSTSLIGASEKDFAKMTFRASDGKHEPDRQLPVAAAHIVGPRAGERDDADDAQRGDRRLDAAVNDFDDLSCVGH